MIALLLWVSYSAQIFFLGAEFARQYALQLGSLRAEELLDAQLSLDAIVWRLFHDEEQVKVFAGPPLARGCRCSQAHYEQVLARFSEEDRAEMRNEAGEIVVDCAFCSQQFVVIA